MALPHQFQEWAEAPPWFDEFAAMRRHARECERRAHPVMAKLLRLANRNPIIANFLKAWEHGDYTFEQALGMMVINLAELNDKLTHNLFGLQDSLCSHEMAMATLARLDPDFRAAYSKAKRQSPAPADRAASASPPEEPRPDEPPNVEAHPNA